MNAGRCVGALSYRLLFCPEASANICEAWVCFLLRLYVPRPILNGINKRWNVNVSSCFRWSRQFQRSIKFLHTRYCLFIYLKSLFSAKAWCTKIEKMMHTSKWPNHQGDSNSRLTEFVFGDEFIHKNTRSKYVVQKQIIEEIK